MFYGVRLNDTWKNKAKQVITKKYDLALPLEIFAVRLEFHRTISGYKASFF